MQIVLYHQQALLKTLVRVLGNKCLGLLFRASSMLKSSRLQEKIIYQKVEFDRPGERSPE